jgi:Na+/proline symporter
LTAALSLALVLAVGLVSARRTRDTRDFFIAGQRLGLLVTGLATMASAFSGFVFLGGPGLTYRIGAASLMICAPVGFTAGLLCWTVARPLRLLSGVRPVLTIPEAIAARYGERGAGRVSAGAAAISIVVGTVGYLGSQILALGVLLDAVFALREALGGAGLPLAMLGGLAIVLVYSAAGGMVAGVWTDVVQGVLMMVTAIGVFAVAWHAGGGPSGILHALRSAPGRGAEFLDPLGGVPAATALGFLFVFSIGVLGQPQMLHKFFMMRDTARLRWMPLVIGGSQTLSLLIWVGVGLTVPALVAGGRMDSLELADAATPAFLLELAPPMLTGLVVAGVLAAIMSTADSFLNIGSAALVRDLPRAVGRRPLEGLRPARWATLAIGAAAFALAWGTEDLIALLGTFAFGTFAAALGPALAVGLTWRRVDGAAAAASIVTGLGVNLGLEAWTRWGAALDVPGPPVAAGALPSAVALAASILVLLAVTAHRNWRGIARPPDPDVARLLDG